jgi:hypothetical protein
MAILAFFFGCISAEVAQGAGGADAPYLTAPQPPLASPPELAAAVIMPSETREDVVGLCAGLELDVPLPVPLRCATFVRNFFFFFFCQPPPHCTTGTASLAAATSGLVSKQSRLRSNDARTRRGLASFLCFDGGTYLG